jgi:hypothetical protein
MIAPIPMINLIDLTEPTIQNAEDHTMTIADDPPEASDQVSKDTAPHA